MSLRKSSLIILFLVALAAVPGRASHRVDSLMAKMTLKEKIGQLNLGGVGTPKVVGSAIGLDEAVRQGLIGAAGGFDIKAANDILRISVDSMRVPVPVLIGLDVIHGYHTIFPIPLGMASSWNTELIEQCAAASADEATSCGIPWTFSPMVDIARDIRWGRVAEGAGEDPYLGSRIAEAMVHGYQGDDLSAPNTMMACVKHFALYGASEAGRDYNTVTVDPVTAYNYYFPPYKAAVDADAGTVMSSFNVVDGVPATGNRTLLTGLLRDKWQFDGFVVSDAGSVGEMEVHGLGSPLDVTSLGINAGCDMDMSSSLYVVLLEEAVRKGLVSENTINEACRRVLTAKDRLGLLEDPYRYHRRLDERNNILYSPEHLRLARQMATEAIVLLKNESNLLPLSKDKKIYIAGSMADATGELLGTWSYNMAPERLVSPREAMREAGFTITGTPGDADVIVAFTGEPAGWSGEAHSRANPVLPSEDEKLISGFRKSGKPVVTVIMSGRPLIVPEAAGNSTAMLEAWHGGTMAAQALADIICGKSVPSGKLTMTWPRSVGQIPLYYNALRTGRPASDFWATSKYLDLPNEPLFPFGYGLSYTTFSYSKPETDKTVAYGENDAVNISVDVTNTGDREGMEIVQLYITDPAARIARPVRELKDFRKINLKPGESAKVVFTVTPDKLKYYDSSLNYGWDEGEFVLAVGPSSATLQSEKIVWKKTSL